MKNATRKKKTHVTPLKKKEPTENGNFGPVSYTTLDAETSVILLSSKEYNVLLRALGTLNQHVQKDERFLRHLLGLNMFQKLVEILESQEDIYLLRFTLKLMVETLKVPECFSTISSESRCHCVNSLLPIFLREDDDNVLESTVAILADMMASNLWLTSCAYSPQVLRRSFVLLKTTSDPDVLRNCLQFLLRLLSSERAKSEVLSVTGFSVPTLVCLQKCKIEEVKEVALDVIRVMAAWKNDVTLALYEGKVVEAMIELLLTPTDFAYHNRALEVINACLLSDDIVAELSQSLEFVKLTRWMQTCPPHAAKLSVRVLARFTKLPKLRQTLFDFSVEDVIISFLKYDDSAILVDTCRAISDMACHKFCCEKMASAVVLGTLLDVLRDRLTNMVPCGDVVLKTMHNFLKRNVKSLDVIAQCKGIPLISDLLTGTEKLSNSSLCVVVDVIQMLVNSKYVNEIANDSIYERLLQLYTDEMYVHEILDIFNIVMCRGDFRKFLLNSKATLLLQNNLKTAKSLDVFTQTLLIIQNAIVYKSLALQFLETGLLDLLTNLPSEIRHEKKTLIDSITNLLYDVCLTLKFHHKNRLEVTDIVRDKFFLYLNYSHRIESSNDKNSPAYVVNYSLLKEKTVDCSNSADLKLSPRRNFDKVIESSSSRLVLDKLTFECKHELDEFIENLPVKCKQKDVAVNYGAVSEDSYLTEYISDAHYHLYGKHRFRTLQQKIQFVARFVVNNLSGLEIVSNKDRDHHHFKLHIAELQAKLGTNQIPIGFLRLGFAREKSLLFKVLADNLNIPATLCRNDKNMYWNEVLLAARDHTPNMMFFVVDLLDNVGKLMAVDSPRAIKYIDDHTPTP